MQCGLSVCLIVVACSMVAVSGLGTFHGHAPEIMSNMMQHRFYSSTLYGLERCRSKLFTFM